MSRGTADELARDPEGDFLESLETAFADDSSAEDGVGGDDSFATVLFTPAAIVRGAAEIAADLISGARDPEQFPMVVDV